MDEPVGPTLRHILRSPPSKMRTDVAEWLNQWRFDRFITLATNDPVTFDGPHRGPALIRDRLRAWDARINRKLIGPKWRQRREDRIRGFYFLEKPVSNPHWHGLVQFFPPWPECREEYELQFDLCSPEIWKQLVPTGTVDIQKIVCQRRVIEYAVKSLDNNISYSNFVIPDEF